MAPKKPRPPKPIEAACLEQITTAQISEFIAGKVRSRELAPKTANRYREILHRLFAWAMDERRVRMPSDRNPVAKVERYKERAPEIRFLTLQQIDNRAVPISRTLRDHLDAYTPAASDHGWFFPSPEGRLWIPDNFSRDLRSE